MLVGKSIGSVIPFDRCVQIPIRIQGTSWTKRTTKLSKFDNWFLPDLATESSVRETNEL